MTVYPAPAASTTLAGMQTTSLTLTLNLSGISVRPDDFTGTLHLQAEAL